MKLSEKNVLISTGILFVIAFAMLKLGNKDSADQLERLSIEIASSSYELHDGKLRLTFEKPPTNIDALQITIVDENNHSISGTSKEENDYIIFETYIPELNYGNTLNIRIETMSTENVILEYKIPEDNIITNRENEEQVI